MNYEFELEHFKAFAGTGPIPLRPITLIYGPNSSGKSSILQALLLLKQTLDESETPETLLLPKGNLVDLGGYREFIHRHEVERPFSIRLAQDMGTDSKAADADLDIYRRLNSLSCGLKISFDYDKKAKNAIVKQYALYANDLRSPLWTFGRKPTVKASSDQTDADPRFRFRRPGATFVGDTVNAEHGLWRIPALAFADPQKMVQVMQEAHKKIYLTRRHFLPYDGDLPNTILRDFSEPRFTGRPVYDIFSEHITMRASQMVRKFLDEMIYLGPLRDFPERHYVFSGNVTGQVGKTGRLVPDLLYKNRRLLKQVNEILEAFGIGYDLVITGSPEGELNDVFSIRLRDRVTKVSASILDVGFGISQVLPVIVQSMLSRNKTVCMEQPEIHLHPRLQAELGTLFAKCIGEPFQNRFIIETHSHHLMLRIQRLIRKGMLKSSDVSVIYVDKGESGSTCLELRLDEEGEFIDRWPNGFFEEGFEEMFST